MPALSAILMRPHNGCSDKSSFINRFNYAFDKSFSTVVGQYKSGILLLFKRRWIVFALFIVSTAGLIWLISSTKTGLVPQEDMGTLSLNIQVAAGSNLAETERVMDEVEDAIKDIPEIYIYSRVTVKCASRPVGICGSFSIRLRDWDERKRAEQNINAVIREIYKRTASISSAQIRVSQSPMISGYGTVAVLNFMCRIAQEKPPTSCCRLHAHLSTH